MGNYVVDIHDRILLYFPQGKANYYLFYLVVLAAFFKIDMIWLGLVARKFYREQLGFIMVDRINWPAAIIFTRSSSPAWSTL